MAHLLQKRNFVKNYGMNTFFEIPSWNGYFGGFIEGPVEQRIIQDLFNMDLSEFKEKYPIYLYGGFLFDPIVFHFGGHKGIYKNKFFEALDRFRFFCTFKKTQVVYFQNYS